MRSRRFLPIVLIIALLIDWYVFQAIKTVTQGMAPRSRSILFAAYWGLSILALASFVLLPLLHLQYSRASSYVIAIILGFYIAKLLALVFLLADDLRRVSLWLFSLAHHRPADTGAPAIPRSTFLSWLGLGLGGGIFGALVYGFSNKYNYKIHRVKLAFDNLPPTFKGLKIIQLSDIHSGSLANPEAVGRGIDRVLAEQPDLILFTGDLVNNLATEMKDYQAVFSRLRAPMGIFSTLGNHDYGDYAGWESAEAKKANLDRLKQIQREMGWRLLMNEHVVLEKDGGQIALIGIENWSAKARFPKYGRMDLAYPGAGKYPFQILMSHDPSHWDAEVRPLYPDIDLMLSGHTHGMQFGIEIPGLKWSPVQFLYRQWAGLYTEGRQHLYVNRGFGFIGYPGRFGILPEITVFELT
ncbi:MAG TPA: metallophosphoesterase [Puia sp.]|jgi:predicted MPP superfamily phosphohydrolase|nr:metallophosphoesterase [Puia sp.]